jgi:hypothetical protein
MTPALFNPRADEAFELFIGTAIGRAEDLYDLDGETAFRRRDGRIETFSAEFGDAELGTMGGLS